MNVPTKCPPPFVAEEEVFHLLAFYGKIHDKKITYDLHKDGILRGHPNGNQYIEVEFDEGVSIPSYFWFDGMSTDTENPTRIQVKHQGQINQ